MKAMNSMGKIAVASSSFAAQAMKTGHTVEREANMLAVAKSTVKVEENMVVRPGTVAGEVLEGGCRSMLSFPHPVVEGQCPGLSVAHHLERLGSRSLALHPDAPCAGRPRKLDLHQVLSSFDSTCPVHRIPMTSETLESGFELYQGGCATKAKSEDDVVAKAEVPVKSRGDFGSRCSAFICTMWTGSRNYLQQGN